MKELKFIITSSSRNIIEIVCDAIEEKFDVNVKWLSISNYGDSSAEIVINGRDEDIMGFEESYSAPYITFLS